MSAESEAKWRKALDFYLEALAEHQRISEALNRTSFSGITPSDSEIRAEEIAHNKVVEARKMMFLSLQEHRAVRGFEKGKEPR